MRVKEVNFWVVLVGTIMLFFLIVSQAYPTDDSIPIGSSSDSGTKIPDVEEALKEAISAVQKKPPKAVNPSLPKNVKVAVLPIPPFAFQSQKGQWEGISIEIWEAISRRWGMVSIYIPTTVEEAEKGLEEGRYDVGLGAFPVVSGAPKNLDFSLPYYVDSVGIGSYETKTDMGLAYLDLFFSWNFVKAALAVVIFIAVGAILVYVFERGKNNQFPLKNPTKGFGNALWWCCGTFTTVGSSVELNGAWSRSVGFLYMCISVLGYSALLGGVTSVLTVTQLSSVSPGNLNSAKLVAIRGGVAAQALTEQMISFRAVDTLKDAFELLQKGEANHLLYAESTLLFLQNADLAHNKNLDNLPKPEKNFIVQSTRLGIQYFSFVYPRNSAIREAIDRDILLLLNLPQWKQIIFRYLGGARLTLDPK